MSDPWASEYLKRASWTGNPYLLGGATGLVGGALVGGLREREGTDRSAWGDILRGAAGGGAVGLGGTAAGELGAQGLRSLAKRIAPANELGTNISDLHGGILGGALGGYAATRLIDEPLNAS